MGQARVNSQKGLPCLKIFSFRAIVLQCFLMASDLRPSPIAGTWYEADPGALARQVDAYMDRADLPDLPGEVMGVIAPHAGHIYSGPVAGYAFAALRGRTPRLIVLISPYHDYHADALLVSSHRAYSTPLGEVVIDRALVHALDARLKSTLGIGLTAIARDKEHSLEIELPFLQRALGTPFQLLPLMVRAREPRVSQGLGRALAGILRGQNFILVGSTDLSHFYTQRDAEKLDAEMLRQIESFSPDGMFAAEFSGSGFACGLGAVTAVLWAAHELGADNVKILHHATSGDVTGDYSSVVGYGAAAILKSPRA